MSVHGGVAWLLLGAFVVFIFVVMEFENRIDDLEDRMTTFETIRIEAIAPPEGVKPLMEYRIHWKALRTGATGYGTGLFPHAEALNYADAMSRNEETKPLDERLLTWWIEPIEATQDDEEAGGESP